MFENNDKVENDDVVEVDLVDNKDVEFIESKVLLVTVLLKGDVKNDVEVKIAGSVEVLVLFDIDIKLIEVKVLKIVWKESVVVGGKVDVVVEV